MSSRTTKVKAELVITIDGPVAAGKTSAAKGLAARLRLSFLDTGAIYRCVALAARRRGLSWGDEPTVARVAMEAEIAFGTRDDPDRVLLNDVDVTEAIRQPEISRGASIVSALPAVRSALLTLQRRQATQGSLIAEGRDTGTVVFPEAEHKFFLTARPEVRAHRRLLELEARGIDSDLREVLAELEDRDRRDSTRLIAPLVPAADCMTIDSSTLSAEEVVAKMESLVDSNPSPRKI